MTSLAASSRLQNAIRYNRKVRKTGPIIIVLQKKAYNSEKVRDTAKDKCTAANKGVFKFLEVNNIGSVFELSSMAFRVVPPYGRLLVELFRWLQKRFRPYPRPPAHPTWIR